MKRFVTVLSGIVVFGWMATVAVFFLPENPGALGFVANPLRNWLDLPSPDQGPHGPLRVIGHLRASLADRSFQGWPIEILGALVFSLWLFTVFVGTGLWIARALGLRGPSRIEGLAVGGALGLGAWGTAGLLLGVARLFHPMVFVGLLALATVLVIPVLRNFWKASSDLLVRPSRGIAESSTIILAAASLLLGLVYALTPAIQSDGLRYHLAAPQEYLRQHGIAYLPFNAFTNFPFLIEMLFVVALGVAGDVAAKMVHFGCFILCGLFIALLTSQLLRDRNERNNAASEEPQRMGARELSPWLAALAFWTAPTALLTAAWEFIDLGTALFFIAMIFALVRWRDSLLESRASVSQSNAAIGESASCQTGETSQSPDQSEKQGRAWLWIAALCLGFVVATKYTMLAMVIVVPLALLPDVFSFVFRRRETQNPPPAIGNPKSGIRNLKWGLAHWFRASVCIAAAALAVASPWFIKNFVFTRNPVYPLAWSIFDGGQWSAENARFYLDKSSQKGCHPRHDRDLGETLRHVLSTPWEATIHWWRTPDGSQHGYEDQFLGPLFLLWIPLLLLVAVNRGFAGHAGSLRLILWFLFAYAALWYLTYQSNRLLIPAIAILSVLVGYSIAVARQTGRWLSNSATLVLFATCLYNLEWSADFIFRETSRKPSPAAYVLGFQSRDSYIRQAFPAYGMYQLMPAHISKGEAVLFVGEHRAYHCPVQWRASDWFDTPLILHHIRSTPDNDALLDRLLDEGTRWVFLNDDELAKYEQDFFWPRFSQAEWKRFADLFGGFSTPAGRLSGALHPRLRPVVQQSGMYLYEILPR